MSRTIYIIVEGDTEEHFVKNILSEYFLPLNIYLKPILIATSRTPHKKYKGGLTSYGKIKRDIERVIRNGDCHRVTTMVDYYRLPDDFPGTKTLPGGDVYTKVKYLETRWKEDIGSYKFIPYIQIHEFEALLFSDIRGFEITFPDKKNEFYEILNRFSNPEEIDDGAETAPSKRIKKIVPGYSKVVDGISIAEETGLEIMLEKCKHFREWIEMLKSS